MGCVRGKGGGVVRERVGWGRVLEDDCFSEAMSFFWVAPGVCVCVRERVSVVSVCVCVCGGGVILGDDDFCKAMSLLWVAPGV